MFISSAENQKGINAFFEGCSIENQKGVTCITNSPLTLNSNSTLLFLNKTSLNSDNALLALNCVTRTNGIFETNNDMGGIQIL